MLLNGPSGAAGCDATSGWQGEPGSAAPQRGSGRSDALRCRPAAKGSPGRLPTSTEASAPALQGRAGLCFRACGVPALAVSGFLSCLRLPCV